MSFTEKPNKITFDINPTNGKLDLITKFNVNSILANEYNEAGRKLVTYDIVNNMWVDAGPEVIFDEECNVITI